MLLWPREPKEGVQKGHRHRHFHEPPSNFGWHGKDALVAKLSISSAGRTFRHGGDEDQQRGPGAEEVETRRAAKFDQGKFLPPNHRFFRMGGLGLQLLGIGGSV